MVNYQWAHGKVCGYASIAIMPVHVNYWLHCPVVHVIRPVVLYHPYHQLHPRLVREGHALLATAGNRDRANLSPIYDYIYIWIWMTIYVLLNIYNTCIRKNYINYDGYLKTRAE